MARWITDRTQSDVDRVKEITAKARTGTWTKVEQSEWLAGMKGALNYTDFNRIESGIQELGSIVGASVSVRTDWTVDGYMKVSDATRWLSNINSIRAKCSGPCAEKHKASRCHRNHAGRCEGGQRSDGRCGRNAFCGQRFGSLPRGQYFSNS